jgi:hypothetical protein
VQVEGSARSSRSEGIIPGPAYFLEVVGWICIDQQVPRIDARSHRLCRNQNTDPLRTSFHPMHRAVERGATCCINNCTIQADLYKIAHRDVGLRATRVHNYLARIDIERHSPPTLPRRLS